MAHAMGYEIALFTFVPPKSTKRWSRSHVLRDVGTIPTWHIALRCALLVHQLVGGSCQQKAMSAYTRWRGRRYVSHFVFAMEYLGQVCLPVRFLAITSAACGECLHVIKLASRRCGVGPRKKFWNGPGDEWWGDTRSKPVWALMPSH